MLPCKVTDHHNLQRQAAENRSLIRKPIRMLAWLAPTTAPPVEQLTDSAGNLLAIPEDYEPVGLIAKESGITFPAESETSTVESVNHAAPTREDFESLTRQITSANATLHTGTWDRKRYKPVDLAGRTVGIVGLGHGSPRTTTGLDSSVPELDSTVPERRARGRVSR